MVRVPPARLVVGAESPLRLWMCSGIGSAASSTTVSVGMGVASVFYVHESGDGKMVVRIDATVIGPMLGSPAATEVVVAGASNPILPAVPVARRT